MSTTARIVAFVVGLGVLFVAAFGAGRLFDEDSGATYRLALSVDQYGEGANGDASLRFTVLDGNDPVTDFAIRHEKPLHLIVVSDDFAEFRHLHPLMASNGEWSINTALRPGDWHLYADFQPDGDAAQVVSATFQLDGTYAVIEPEGGGDDPGELRFGSSEDTDHGASVTGNLVAGSSSRLTFRVIDRDGPIADLEPYLGAFGHLVVLRDSDMKYLHVHPEEGPSGPDISFQVEVPTAGRYHLYLDFQHDGIVHTVPLMLDASDGSSGNDEHGDDHGDH